MKVRAKGVAILFCSGGVYLRLVVCGALSWSGTSPDPTSFLFPCCCEPTLFCHCERSVVAEFISAWWYVGRSPGRGRAPTLRGCFVAGTPRNDKKREQPPDKISPGRKSILPRLKIPLQSSSFKWLCAVSSPGCLHQLEVEPGPTREPKG